MLAPMTNTQSHPDGRLSEEEYHWLSLRAQGGFGLTMTCASHVQPVGQGFPGQLGIYAPEHEAGHRKLSKALKEAGSLALIQLHHAGMRSPADLIGTAPRSASDQEKYKARALSHSETQALRDDFILAAKRAQAWGYDGVELHGAHGYILCQYLSSAHNRREDEYGGSLENRSRLIREILKGIREACGPYFLLGIRLSPERFGMKLDEIKTLSEQLCQEGLIDFLDLSLWDVFKNPIEAPNGPSLLEYFSGIERGNVKLTVAGKIRTGHEVQAVLDTGVDFLCIGRAAILHHDYPLQLQANPNFEPIATPVSSDYLAKEGLSPVFINYMRRWKDFVAEE